MSIVVRNARLSDVTSIVRVHERAFPGFFLTDLGPRFLHRLYAGFVDEADGILLVAEEADGAAVGLLAGTRSPERFFRSMRRRQGVAMAFAAIPALLRRPRRVAERLLAAVRYRGDAPVTLPGYWLLSSLGVALDRAGTGAGTALVQRFCAEAEAQGAPGIYLLTDKNDNDAARRFYAGHGFDIHAEQLRRDGRQLLVLTRRLAQ